MTARAHGGEWDARAGSVARLQGAACSGRGIYLGLGARGWAWSGAQRSTLVLGPSRSGKTSSLVVPNVLSAPGAVLTTSTKPDVLRATAGARASLGWCLAFDPTGELELPPGVHRVGWSPVSAAREWHAALEVSDAMVRTARGRPNGAVGAGAEGHWSERAAALLAPLLHAASLDDAPMRAVLRWVDRHDGAPALDVLATRLGDDAVATDLLAGILSTDPREQSGIWSTASGVLAAYRSPGALASTEPPLLDPDAFCAGTHTMYVCAPAARQQLLAPLVVAMLSEVRDAAYRRASRAGGFDGAPVLFALDEVANIAPLPTLPSLVTDGPGQGLLTLACLQDLSQARARWGTEADAFVSIFGTTVVLGGIADIRTLEALSALSGDREVRSRTVGFTDGAGGRQVSTTDAAVLRRRLPVDVVARGAHGWGLCVDARNRLGWVRLTPAHESWPWRDCIPTGRARTQGLLASAGLSWRALGRTPSAGCGAGPRGRGD
ncbi:MAG: type IV secretory system conjugative DNA transfer family protein [Acidimicrobiales bacterium]